MILNDSKCTYNNSDLKGAALSYWNNLLKGV